MTIDVVRRMAALAAVSAVACGLWAVDGGREVAAQGATIVTTDRYVKVVSTVPAITGQTAQLFVRERALATTLAAASLEGRVVLFVHGAGTPAEVAFDVPYQDYSWMAALARAGLDVFAMDVSGYGRSTRPWPMNDPCNLSAAQQALFVPSLIPAPCAKAAYPSATTTIASDWDDIGAVVDHIRELRQVERVSLIGWSLGGPRAGGYAVANPGKVDKLVLLSPAYTRTGPSAPPAQPPAGAAFNTQSRAEFDANWDRQVGCAGQFEMAARESVWAAMVQSDPVGATWGTGVRRAPQTLTWGWNRDAAVKLRAPLLAVAAANDVQVLPARVHELFEDAGSPQKMVLDLGCASHNSLWERVHGALFKASAEWLTKGSVNGVREGNIKIGAGE